MAKVLIMGADIQSERAVIRRLQSLCGSPSARLDMCHDVASCDLLVVQKDSAMRNVLDRIVRNRPALPLWLLDREGRLADGLCTTEAPLSEDAIRRVLLRMPGRQPDALRRTQQAPRVRSTDEGSVRGIEALAPAVHRRMADRDGAAALRLDGRPAAWLDFAAGVAVPGDALDCPPELFEHRLGEVFHRLVLHPARADGGAARPDSLPQRPLARLLWKAALRLHLPGEDGPPALLSPGTALRLRGWPDFRMLAHHHDHFRLCSLLLKRSCTAAEAGRLLDIEDASVRAFFNAAYLSGHATVSAATAGPASGGQRRGAGALLATMWRRVRDRVGS